MIEELLAALVESGADAAHEELADILWLAARIGAAGSRDNTGDEQQPDSVEQGTASPSNPDRGDGGSQASERYYSATLEDDARAVDPDTRRGEAVLVRRAMALEDPLGVMRALRPLGRQTVPAVNTTELDEELSVDSSVEQGMVVPILKPQRGRWLDLALVIDTHHSMLLWHDLVSELCRTFAQTGIFRDVRLWFLSGTEVGGIPTVARANGGDSRRPQEVSDPSGHRLVLVVTDTVAGGWSGTSLQAVLRQWVAHNPLALLNVLPRRLWTRGAVAPEGVVVRAARPAAPNVSWRLAQAARQGGSSRLSSRSRVRAGLAGSIAIPMVEASPSGLGALASLVAGEGRWSRLSCLTIDRTGTGIESAAAPALAAAPDPDAKRALRRFQESASPVAQELAGYLSAVPLTLPVMTLVRRAMLPHSKHGHLAEVALGGLLEGWQDGHGTFDMARFEFHFLPGVREALLGAQLRHDITAVQELVRREVADYVERLAGGSGGDFPATRTTAGGTGERSIGPGAMPFAESALPRVTPMAETRPLQLGVHMATPVGNLPVQFPTYVEREYDARLRDIVRGADAGEPTFVVLVGDEGAGKTRSAWEAVRNLPDGWVLWAPPTAEDLREGVSLIGPRTVVWLDDLERFGNISAAQYDSLQAAVLVVGTARSIFWADSFPDSAKRRATVIHVPGEFLESEFAGETANTGSLASLSARRQTVAERFSFLVPGGVVAMASVPALDGRTYLATYSRPDGKVRTWDPEAGSMVGESFTVQEPGIAAIAAVPLPARSPLLATTNHGGEVHLWGSADGSFSGVRYDIRKGVLSMTEFVEADEPPRLAFTDYSGRLQIRDAVDGTPVGNTLWTGGYPGRAMTALVDPAGRRCLVTADYSGAVRLWNLNSKTAVPSELFIIRPQKVLAMAAIDRVERHSLLATIGYDNVIRVWDPFVTRAISDPGRVLDLDAMDPIRFEELVLHLLNLMNEGRVAIDARRNAGIDGVITHRVAGQISLVQVKHTRREVAYEVIRDLSRSVRDRDARKGIIVTNGTFSKAGIEFAENSDKIQLIDGRALRELIREHLGI
ncbi:SAV_2336 N-terminal domain-related protein [Streptomyces sp. Ncost-T10-10d]|uniref:SAV_2336 N-terminal domain-related protein n=1 Tax=Streptomyces sp. Ncost-T10-10d TaxID=1839774 RepID=UPI00081EEFE6|nr:SAV_2336 N-terminal domain-related protein [Streptomyces sp. Ncost-T10-10d]SCF56449.1 Restriction endonuclease [Streptomyces sp. Ncost-T10-10d]